MLVDCTLWEMAPGTVDRPSVLAVVATDPPVFLITETGNPEDPVRDATRLLVHLDTAAPVDVAALDAAPRLTLFLESRADWRLTTAPFRTRIHYSARTSRRAVADRLRAAVARQKRLESP